MIAWFARHPTAANLFMAVFLIAGLVTVPGLQRETFPEIQNDEVQAKVGAARFQGRDEPLKETAEVSERVEDVLAPAKL